MDITIQVDPETEPGLYDWMRDATDTLKEIMGPRAARFVTEIEWSRLAGSWPEGPKDAVRLKMTDRLAGTVEEMFKPVELRSPGYMKARLREVWGRFLRQLSGEQMDRIEQLASSLEGD